MKRFCLSLLMVVAAASMSIMLFACGSEQQPVNDVPGDTLADVTSDVVDAVDDQVDDTGRDTAGETGDVPPPCNCEVVSECCDGCYSLKENEACALTVEEMPFCKTPLCIAGECVLGDVTCTGDGKCAEGTGTCDPQNGICVFPNARPDGESCTAMNDIDGSGACLFGACEQFTECDNRAYDQVAGMPCNFNSECASGLCLAGDMGWDQYCSQSCENGVACPDGLRCTKNYENKSFCTKIGTTGYPGDGTMGLFKPCNVDEDCAGGLCLGYEDKRFCSANCEATAGGTKDSTICGDCGLCRDGGTALEFKYEFYCVPDSDGLAGSPCQSPMDCGTHFCFEGYCSEQCFIFSEELDSCPNGFKCVADAYEVGLQTCVIDTSLGREFGEICMHDYECTTGSCRAIGGTSYCVTGCDTCSAGACQQVGWIQTNTLLELWNGTDAAALATDDNNGNGDLSSLNYYATVGGTYYVVVKGGTAEAAGPYKLHVVVNNEIGTPAEVTEVEANDSLEAAEVKIAPFLIAAQLEAAGQDWFKFDVTLPQGITSVRVMAETLEVPENLCVPTTIDGTTVYGDACTWDWQCTTGLSCMDGTCNKTCAIDGDCPDGICYAYSDTDKRCVPADLVGVKVVGETCGFPWECIDECYPDEYLQEYYCSKACSVDGDCAWGMGCLGGMCSKAFPSVSFPYGYCRMNADCESYICIDGICTTDCEADEDCEGFAAIVPAGQKELCSSCETNTDCNDGTEDFFSEAYCIQVSETEKFCAPQCTFFENICPEGTRCYSIDGFTKVCAPVSFTCAGGKVGCEETNGICLRPYIQEGNMCRFDEECIGGKCAGGVCRSAGCDNTLECACDLLECIEGYCQFVTGVNGVLEVEPNNTVNTAQQIMSLPTKIIAGFNAEGNLIDNDIYKTAVVPGFAYSFNVTAACDTPSDPAMILRDENGEYISGWAADDKSQTDYFPALFGYMPEANSFLYVEIVQSPYVDGVLRTPYVLDITLFEPEAGNTCADALAFDVGAFSGAGTTFDNLTSSITPPTSLGEIWGPDMARYIDVPGVTTVGTYAAVRIGMSITPKENNLVMYAVTDCATPDSSLVTWSNFNVDGGMEQITLINQEATPKRFTLVMDSYSWDPAAVSLEVYLQAGETPAPSTGNDIAHAEVLEPVPGATLSSVIDLALPYTNAIGPTEGACAGKATAGKDYVFNVVVPAGTFLKVQTTDAFTSPIMYILDGDDPNACAAYGSGTMYYMPPVAEEPTEPTSVYVVVEASGHPGGELTFSATVENVGACAGPCDPVTAGASCEVDGKLCYCDETLKFFQKLDCNASCVATGYALSGACHVYATEGIAVGPKCQCEYDCAMEGLTEDMCGSGSYTNCTCAASDPCSWVGDGTCDGFCTTEYASFNPFEDTADCTPAE